VKIYIPAEPGTHIRRAGSAMSEGTLLMTAGTIIGPPQISALVTSGLHRVKVIRRPRIGVIATGNELQSMGRPLVPGKIYNSNGPAVASMVSCYEGIPKVLGIACDREASLLAKIRKGLKWDGIITTGGVSMGDYDVVRLLMGKEGKPLFSRVKMEPGRAVLFSLLERKGPEGVKITVPLFGLAGPPAAGLVNFEMLVRPALLKMRGVETTDPAGVDAVAADAFSNGRPVPLVKWTILTGSCGAYCVTLCGSRNTGESIPMEKANSLVVIPAESSVNPGDTIQVRPLDWGGGAFFP
jgi:molybdopterin molybdotransferase